MSESELHRELASLRGETSGTIDRPEPSPGESESQTPKADRPEERGRALAFPQRYDVDRCRIMARDPYWIHAYWEIRPSTLDELHEQVGGDRSSWRHVLRTYSIPAEASGAESQPAGFFDIEVGEEATSWYVHVGIANRLYQVEVGVQLPDGTFHRLAASNRVRTPPDRMSEEVDASWASTEEEARELYEFSGDSPVKNIPAGPSRPGQSEEEPPRPRERGRPEGHPHGELSSPWSSSPTSTISGVSGDLWFNLNVEVVLTGASSPGSEVRIQDVPVRVREDGSFQVKLQLPDGRHEISAIARSPKDGSEIHISPRIVKETRYEEREEKS